MIAKRRHHQRTGPLQYTFSKFMKVDRLQGLLEFGADPFVLKKQDFLISG